MDCTLKSWGSPGFCRNWPKRTGWSRANDNDTSKTLHDGSQRHMRFSLLSRKAMTHVACLPGRKSNTMAKRRSGTHPRLERLKSKLKRSNLSGTCGFWVFEFSNWISGTMYHTIPATTPLLLILHMWHVFFETSKPPILPYSLQSAVCIPMRLRYPDPENIRLRF